MKSLFITVMLSFVSLFSYAQNTESKYRRSSLDLILLETDNFPKKEVVLNSYEKAPFPDKYNEHSIDVTFIDPSDYSVSEEDRAAYGIKEKSGAGELTSSLKSVATIGIVDENEEDKIIIIDKALKANNVATKMVAKWFNRSEGGSFDLSIISERGLYDATELDFEIAEKSTRGTALLADAGEELINNTFTVVTEVKYLENEPFAAVARDVAISNAENISIALVREGAITAAEVAYEKAKEGYTVFTTSYLYQLEWNDEIANTFYGEYWVDKANLDQDRIAKFDANDLFKMKYIGQGSSSTLVTFSLKEKRTEDEVINLATVRNINAVYAKLQKKYSVFQCKTPILTASPITAKIGMKEGLKGGEKFEVLEQVYNEKTGKTEYVSKGKITVDKNKVWDNRYGDNEEDESLARVTYFKGSKKLYPGMFIKQIK